MKYFVQNAGYKNGVFAVRCEFEAAISKEMEGKMVEVDQATFDQVKSDPKSYRLDKDGVLKKGG